MSDKTVIKLNNIPHGFFEDQMRKYFSQFGRIRNVLLIRSKKTHKSRGFGFIEFELPQVAKATAEAMHNYLFFNQVLKCRQMKRSDLPSKFFNIKFNGKTSVQLNKEMNNAPLRDIKLLKSHYRKIKKTEEELRSMGIDFKCHIVNQPEGLEG